MDREKRDAEKKPAKGGARPSSNGKSVLDRLQCFAFQDRIVLVSLSLVVALVLSSTFVTTGPTYRVGDVADQNVKAKLDLLIEDEQPTQKKREEAAQESPLIYDFDGSVAAGVVQRLDSAFEAQRQLLQKHVDALSERLTALPPDRSVEAVAPVVVGTGQAGAGDPQERAEWARFATEQKGAFEHALGSEVPDSIYPILIQKKFSRDIQELVRNWLQGVLQRGVVANRQTGLQVENKTLLIRNVQSKQETSVASAKDYLDLNEAQQYLYNQAAAQAADTDAEIIKAALQLGICLLQSNLSFNLSETESRKEAAANAVKPVFIQLKKNEMLVREGQRIGPQELLKLRAYAEKTPKHNRVMIFISLFLLTALFIRVFVYVAQQHLPDFRLSTKDLMFLAILMALLVILARVSTVVIDSISDQSVYFTGKAMLYAVPLTAGAMFCSIFFGVSVSLIFSLLLMTLTGVFWGKDFYLIFYFLLGSFVAAHGVATCRNRMAPIQAGALVGACNVGVIVLASLLQDKFGPVTVLANSLCGFCGGLFAGIMVTGLTPLAEMIFGYTTDIKLLELASMDQPLLQELMLQTPGTYHHSVIVSNMVEAAAKAIGANSLLAKVAAYYHDIGKVKKSLYFIENQFDGDNRHEKLAPSMSSLILIAHVKEGVELARQHRLGQPIVDIISQHHGTRLISFFYQKALDAREKNKTSKGTELPPIEVQDYRYPGPKPQTKEAGLVMLADVVEAACRALPEPTSARIQGLVSKLINNIFIDGQLDECELTLKDLHQIARRFNQILASIHHKRIDYPAIPPKDSKSKVHADPNQRETKVDRDRPATTEEGGQVDLRRLGLH
jgi:putative nucleotidyltransferase with HDIG domain